MPEITPEERVQKVKSRLLEDLEFEPEQVVNFYTRNIFQRALAHLVGWTGLSSKMLRCTEAGELKTAPTSTGIEHNGTFEGTATDDYGMGLNFDQVASRLDIFVWDNAMRLRRYNPMGVPHDTIEIPVGFYSIDAVTCTVQVKNETPGQNARWQIVGWW